MVLTLQAGFTYDDSEPAPVDSTDIVIGFPHYEVIDDPQTKTVSLAATGQGHISFEQRLSSKQYHVAVPASELWGSDYGATLIRYVTSLTKTDSKVSLQDFTIPFTVQYSASGHVAPSSVDALYFFSGARFAKGRETAIHVPRPSLTPSSEATASSATGSVASNTGIPTIKLPKFDSHPLFLVSPDIIDSIVAGAIRETSQNNHIIDTRIFCLNKSVYLSFLQKLFPTSDPQDESLLLYLLSGLVDISGKTPRLSSAPDATKRAMFQTTLKDFGQAELAKSDAWVEVYDTIVKGFDQFFEFPLVMPKMQLFTVAGVLHINDPAKKVLTMSQFSFYHLSANFAVQVGDPEDNEPIQHISRYDWPADASPKDNSLNFKFQDTYALDAISGTVIMSITGYDNAELFSQQFNPSDPALQNLNIAVDLRVPPILTGSSGQTFNKKLRGKIVAMTKICSLKGSVVVQAKAKNEDPWSTVSTGVSDKTGNFVMPYPYGKYVAAQALTSLEPTTITALKIDDANSAIDEAISIDFIYILLQKTSDSNDLKKEECGCNPTTTAGRLPSQDDLIHSDQYTQDVGGACMNLSVPNRTLREFTYTAVVRNSDPDVANYTLTSLESIDEHGVRNVSYQLTNLGKITRRRIDLNNPIRWEDVSGVGANETLYEAVTVATGHVLHYKSEFRADGYSLGNLLYSLPLAPGQKKEIVIIDSSHSFRGSEAQFLSQTEHLASDLVSERDVIDQIGGNIGEQLAGSSEADTGGVAASAGASGGAGAWSANVGVAGGYSKSTSSANQTSGRNLAGFFSENLRQGIHQNAQSYRRQNSAIVTTANEAQRFQTETTVISNHNHCHAITILHYEVLRHFAVYQEAINAAKWADALCTRLLPLHANTYRNPNIFYGSGRRHPLYPAFDAVERVRTNWELVDWPNGPYCKEQVIWAQGEYTASVNIPRPVTRYDMILSLPIITQHKDDDSAKSFFLGFITGGLSLLADGSSSSETQVRADISDKFMRLDPTYRNRRPADCIRIVNVDPVTAQNSTGFDPVDFFHDSPRDFQAWETFSVLLGNGRGKEGIRKTMKYYFLNATISEWSDIWNAQIAPKIYQAMFESVHMDGLAIDFAKLNDYKGGSQLMRVSFNGTGQATREQIQFIVLSCQNTYVATLKLCNVEWNMKTLRISYSTQHFNGLLYSGNVNNDIFDDVTVHCPLTEGEIKNPRQDDRWLSQRLITHLNRNLEYYNRVLLYSLDAQRRFMLLDGFHIQVYNEAGSSAGYHSLSSVLKNAPITMVGNSLVFPVAPGYKVDRSLILENGDGESSGTSLLDLYRPEIPPSPYRISVPSRGVYSESIMGNCDSCEKLKPDSSQDWTKFTTDEPTAINAVQPPQIQNTTYNPAVKDFSTPMISIQNAPTAPDPGAGLAAAGLTELLGKAGIFKDITGLDQNQKNAMATYTANLQAAQAAAGMASAAATQAHNTGNSSAIMGTITAATDSGFLTKAEAGQLVKEHIQGQIDGGKAHQAAIELGKSAAKTSLSDAAVEAVKSNKAVEASTVDPDGNLSTVKISPGSSKGSIQAKVSPAVPIIKQKPDTPTCWAAAAAMMASWKAGRLLTIEDALKAAGDQYVRKYRDNLGLRAEEKDAFIKAMLMVSETPMSSNPSTFVKWMKNYGPLWVTTDAIPGKGFSPHAKILIQIDGDGNDNGVNTTFTWIDPSTGDMPKQSFKDFLVGYQEMVTDNSGALFTQVVHFAELLPDAPQRDASEEGSSLEGPFNFMDPVHENLTISALIGSSLHVPDSTTLKNSPPHIKEFVRGVFFNDDPALLLFHNDEKNTNWHFTTGYEWFWTHINYGNAHRRDESTPEATEHYWHLTERSHFWDLQFLHAMASTAGEDAHETLGKVMLWLEIMYKLATDQGVKPTDKLADITISSQVDTRLYTLSTFFNTDSQPPSSATINFLLCADTPFTGLQIKFRALGSILHVIQDSYMKGHTKRTLTNPGDLMPRSQDTFQPGKWAQLGEIENFHTYVGQNKEAHERYDRWDDKWGKMVPGKPESFDPLYGARQAREKSVEMVNFFARDPPASWAEVRNWLLGQVFVFAANISPANTDV
ncbi:hypothetical protein TWF281_010567 [Arthrobotrys megalospora]